MIRTLLVSIALAFAACGTDSSTPDAAIDFAPFDSPPYLCRYPDGRVCGDGRLGSMNQCPADDGCNTCRCEFSSFACTQAHCAPDGGSHD